MKKGIRFEIGQNEWNALPEDKQERLKELMREYFGVDVKEMIDNIDTLEELDEDDDYYSMDTYACGCCTCCGCFCYEEDDDE